MSPNFMHLIAPGRDHAAAVIIGDRAALLMLRQALSHALDTGSAGVTAYCSDGEPYRIAVVLEQEMQSLHTAYPGEVGADRSARETVALPATTHFGAALRKAARS